MRQPSRCRRITRAGRCPSCKCCSCSSAARRRGCTALAAARRRRRSERGCEPRRSRSSSGSSWRRRRCSTAPSSSRSPRPSLPPPAGSEPPTTTRRSRRPPRRLPLDSGGTASGRTSFGGGGSESLADRISISSRNFWPTEPSPEFWYASARAASVTLPATMRTTFGLSPGGVLRMMSQCEMQPECVTCVEVDMPASARFFEPRICTTVEGSSASLDMPPAAPTSFAAVAAPTMATTLGATIAILDSTKARMRCLLSERARTCSHRSLTAARACGGSSVPMVVEEVTVTTMIVAEGRMPVRSTWVRSASLPILRTTRAKSSGFGISDSSSGNRFA
mmetsp:Transcript_43925/g.142558  ORF Transcript_43925/g.142558 Transcript_43925/m.142558 type:complete len:335 (-) Transcript_43925:406-1410(-)